MWNARAFADGQFGGADIQAAVELQRVAVHHFAAEFEGQLDRKVALAGAGGADQTNQRKRVLNWRRYTL